MARLPLIEPCESVTALEHVDGKVLVAGSHGGLIAASYAAKALVHAVIFNDGITPETLEAEVRLLWALWNNRPQ